MTSWAKIKIGDITSEYCKPFCPSSFWHNSNLKTNSKINTEKLQIARKAAVLYRPSKYIRIKTIEQKYEFIASQMNKGTKVDHQSMTNNDSNFRAVIILKINIHVIIIHISKTVIPNQLTISFKVKNIFMEVPNNSSHFSLTICCYYKATHCKIFKISIHKSRKKIHAQRNAEIIHHWF